jgi:hypothetical protein
VPKLQPTLTDHDPPPPDRALGACGLARLDEIDPTLRTGQVAAMLAAFVSLYRDRIWLTAPLREASLAARIRADEPTVSPGERRSLHHLARCLDAAADADGEPQIGTDERGAVA